MYYHNNKLLLLDVNVLASAFNIDKADLMGRVHYVPDFMLKDSEGNVIVMDGSKSMHLFVIEDGSRFVTKTCSWMSSIMQIIEVGNLT